MDDALTGRRNKRAIIFLLNRIHSDSFVEITDAPGISERIAISPAFPCSRFDLAFFM